MVSKNTYNSGSNAPHGADRRENAGRVPKGSKLGGASLREDARAHRSYWHGRAGADSAAVLNACVGRSVVIFGLPLFDVAGHAIYAALTGQQSGYD